MSSVTSRGDRRGRTSGGGGFSSTSLAVVCAFLAALLSAGSVQADRLILRNLSVLNDVSVQSFDLDGVRLADGRTFGWDEIERGQVSPDRQAEFDRTLAEVGIPLLRIRQNLESGAFERLAAVVEPVLDQYQNRRGPTAYLVNQAAMWGRLAQGRREEATASYARCLALLSEDPAAADRLPGKRRMEVDPATGLVRELSPIYFDSAAARSAYEDVVATIRERNLRQPGMYAYAGALAIAAGEIEVAEKVQASLQRPDPANAALRELLALQLALAKKSPDPTAAREAFDRWSRSAPSLQPAWIYSSGAAMTASEDPALRDEGIAALLHVPALFAATEPIVAAAALDAAARAVEGAGDAKGAAKLRAELTGRFPESSFARELTASPP